jgi:hypothetical protein
MRRRIRWTRAGKWAGVVTLAAIAAIWFVNGRWGVGLHRLWPTSAGYTSLWLEKGCLGYDAGIVDIAKYRPALFPKPLLIRAPRGWRWTFRFDSAPVGMIVVVPLWAPWVGLLLSTFWLWRLDRPRPPEVCAKCGYDLTGNTIGVCPECGAKGGGEGRGRLTRHAAADQMEARGEVGGDGRVSGLVSCLGCKPVAICQWLAGVQRLWPGRC